MKKKYFLPRVFSLFYNFWPSVYVYLTAVLNADASKREIFIKKPFFYIFQVKLQLFNKRWLETYVRFFAFSNV